jgi:hypothetical protein
LAIITKSVAAVDTMPDDPRKVAMLKEISIANTAMSNDDMRGACESYIRAQKMVRSKVEGLMTPSPPVRARRVFLFIEGAFPQRGLQRRC